jgi:uncharacterized protein (DUF1778 family)
MADISMHALPHMRTTTIQIRLLPNEKDAFERAAELSGISVSAWVRERLRSAAIRELESAGQTASFVAPAESSAAR